MEQTPAFGRLSEGYIPTDVFLFIFFHLARIVAFIDRHIPSDGVPAVFTRDLARFTVYICCAKIRDCNYCFCSEENLLDSQPLIIVDAYISVHIPSPTMS